MKTKVNKLVKLATAGLFLIALAINVKVTLDDPFVMLSEQAIATGSSGGSGTGGEDCPGKVWWDTEKEKNCKVLVKVGEELVSNGNGGWIIVDILEEKDGTKEICDGFGLYCCPTPCKEKTT